MVHKQITKPEVYSTYIVKSGQMDQTKKVPEKTLVLMASNSTFQRYVDYGNVEERKAEQMEAAAVKLEAVKKATYEMSKTWDNTIENIKKRRKEELLSKSRKAEEERRQFVKEMTAKNAAERAEIVKQARKLLLYKQPQCRRINRALLVSECYRELDAQLAFRQKIRDIEKEREDEYVKSMWKDVEEFMEEQKKKADERKEKRMAHNRELKEQIEENERTRKDEEKRELELEIQDQKNMSRDLQLIKECQAKEVAESKKKLRQMYKEIIEDKQRFADRAKTAEKFEDLTIEIYKKSQAQLKKMIKQVAKEEKATRERMATAIAKTTALSNVNIHEIEEANYLKAKAELEAAEDERQKARKEFEQKMKAERLESKRQDDERKRKIEQEKKEFQQWEIQRRFKQDEYNKQVLLENKNRERQKKLEQARVLREHMAQQEAEKKRVETLDDDYEKVIKSTEIVNNKVLSYADEVLEECKGVRPLYPVLKAIKECKKEMGIREVRQQERPQSPVRRPKRDRGVRRAICNKTSGEMNSHFL